MFCQLEVDQPGAARRRGRPGRRQIRRNRRSQKRHTRNMTKSGSTTTKYLDGQGQTGKPEAKRDSGGQFVSRKKPAKSKRKKT